MNQTMVRIDTSYWKINDPEWVAEREASWPRIAFMLTGYKETKKVFNAIRAYYLKGKMPNWKSMKNWNSPRTHLDLFTFLWLHPSWDEDVLTNLRNIYINSELVMIDDVAEGFRGFFDSQVVIASSKYTSMDQVPYPFLDGYGELIFKILMLGDPGVEEYELATYSLKGREMTFRLPIFRLRDVCQMGVWLTIEKLLPIHENFLYQYDLPLQCWSSSPSRIIPPDVDIMRADRVYNIEKALYRIHHFDTIREGETCRTRFVQKIRIIFDESEFFPEFKQVWHDIKNGNIVVFDAWEP